MRYFNKDKTLELSKEFIDKTKYKLIPDKLFIKHYSEIPEIQEKFHYEVLKVYPNGGKDVKKVIDIEYSPKVKEYDEFEDIYVCVPYSDKEIAIERIKTLKTFLAETDYKAIKYSEHLLTDEEYEPIKQQRQRWRDEINELEIKYSLNKHN